jgi:hypothetical protein
MMGAYTGILAATTPTHPCCTTGDRVFQESSKIYDAIGYVVLAGVGFGTWALLGVRAETSAADETTDTEIDKRELVHPYSGPLSLTSGRTVPLTGSGVDVEVSELSSGFVHIGQSAVPIEGLSYTPR